jgi:hypothetical protein
VKCENGCYLKSPTERKLCLIQDEFGLQKCKNCRLFYINPDGTCKADCPIGYYPDRRASHRICTEFTDFCISCDMYSYLTPYCTLCKVLSYKLRDFSYVLRKLHGFYRCYPECCACLSGCDICTDDKKCQACNKGHVLLDYCTYDECKPGIMNRDQCSDTVTCNQCSNGYVAYSGQSCRVDCKSDNYITNPSGQCYIPTSGGGGGTGTGGTDLSGNFSITCNANLIKVTCQKFNENNTVCMYPMICPPCCITCYIDNSVIKFSRCMINYYINPLTNQSCATDFPERYYKSTGTRA